MSHPTFVLDGIDPIAAEALRAQGGITDVTDEQPGYPCRQCLRDAEIGEEVILVSHDPFTASSPYRCASPIFIHREPCRPHHGTGLPEQLARGQRSVRAFDAATMMLDAAAAHHPRDSLSLPDAARPDRVSGSKQSGRSLE